MSVVAGPRNQLILQGAALIVRPFFVCSKCQDSGEIAVQVDFQFALIVRRQGNSVDQRPEQVGGFRLVLFAVQRLREVRDLIAVVGGHAGMEQDGLFLRSGEKG